MHLLPRAEPKTTARVLLADLCYVCWSVADGGDRWLQVQCSRCGHCHSKDGHALCWTCRQQLLQQQTNAPATAITPVLDPLAQIGENATQLLAALPPHSHHRSPLLNQLSQHIPSSTAATLLHAAPSTVRNAKRKDSSGSDLLTEKYARNVKRQKIESARVEELCDFVATACPTKSGERSVTYHQFTTDALLYSAYREFTPRPVSFNTFRRVKQFMRVRRASRYLGQFDCSKCVTYNKLQHKPSVLMTAEEEHDLRRCLKHRKTLFRNASTISR